MSPRDQRPGRRTGLAALVAALLLSAVPIASAQTGSAPVATGTFHGAITINGGFNKEVEGGEFLLLMDGGGPLELTLTDGTMEGSWSMKADQQILGDFDGGANMYGDGGWDATGSVHGPPGTYSMTGGYTFSNTVTVTIADRSISTSSSDSGTIDIALSEMTVLCDYVFGRFDWKVKQEIQGAGFDENIAGLFTVRTDTEKHQREAQALSQDIGRWAAKAATLEPGGKGLFVSEGLGLLSRSEGLQAKLASETPCPKDPTFANELTQATQDALSTLISKYPGITTPTVVSLALASGAIGRGSATSQAATALQNQMEADVNEAFDRSFAEPGGNRGDVINLARSAQQLGMDTIGSEGNLTPSEVLLVEGVSE